MKISNMIISLLLVGMFVTVFAMIFSNIADNYSGSFVDDNITSMDKFEDVNAQVADINQSLMATTESGGVTDLLGAFLGSGFKALKLTRSSFGTLISVSSDAGASIPASSTFIPYILVILLVLFLFAIIAVLTGKEI